MAAGHSLAVLSHTHPPLFEYFQANVRPVTNPPIDACGESGHRHHRVCGPQGNLLEEAADNCKVLKINNPILTETDLLKIKVHAGPGSGGDRLHLLL